MRWCIYIQLTLAALGAGFSQATCRLWRYDVPEFWKEFIWSGYEFVMFLSMLAILIGPIVFLEISRRRLRKQQRIGWGWLAEPLLVYAHFITALPGVQ